MTVRDARVVLIGAYPPPLGGNTIHIQRLVSRLLAERKPVTILDVYNPGGGEADASNPGRLAFSRLGGRRRTSYFRLLCMLRARVRDAIVHFHISAGANFYRYAWLLGALTHGARKRVLTIHSGGWVAGFESLSRSKQEAALRVIDSFDDVICVNAQQHALLSRHLRSRLHLIPAYLPPPLEERPAVPQPVRALQQAVDVVIVTSGSRTPVYDYETLLRGIQLAQPRLASRLGLVIATYNTRDEQYWEHVTRVIASSGVPAMTTADLSPSQFLTLLAQAGLYVRSTLADGDAVAIREAGSVGTRVIASDAVPRPPGTALFHSGDAEGLAARLVEALQDPEVGRLSRGAFPDNYKEILKVYGVG